MATIASRIVVTAWPLESFCASPNSGTGAINVASITDGLSSFALSLGSVPLDVQTLLDGAKVSELDRLVLPSAVPPATSTVPSGNNVAV